MAADNNDYLSSILGIGGAGLGAIGGLISGASSNEAARKARDWYQSRTREAQARYYDVLGYRPEEYFDPGGGQRVVGQGSQIFGSGSGGGSNTGEGELPTGFTGGGVLGLLQGLADSTSARQTGNLAYFDNETADLNSREDAATSNLSRLNAGAEAMAKTYGVGQEATIRKDADRRLTSANRGISARLRASGLGDSTIVGNQMAGASAQIGEAADRSIASVRQSAIDRLLAARGQTIGSTQNQANASLARRAGRSSDRMGLEERNLNRDISLRESIPRVLLQGMSSPIANPWAGQNTSQYYPGVSGAGNALQSAGSSAGAISGQMMTQDFLDDYLNRIRPQTGGGNG